MTATVEIHHDPQVVVVEVHHESTTETVEIEVPGPAGTPGPEGPPGPPGSVDDLPDMMLIFENGLL
jgi:hypothetical protein